MTQRNPETETTRSRQRNPSTEALAQAGGGKSSLRERCRGFRHAVLVTSMLFAAAVSADTERLTEFELTHRLMAFYGSYQEGLAETLDRQIENERTAEARHYLQTVKVVYADAALDIASGDSPAYQLLNMLILLRLQVAVWSDGPPGVIGRDPVCQHPSQQHRIGFICNIQGA